MSSAWAQVGAVEVGVVDRGVRPGDRDAHPVGSRVEERAHQQPAGREEPQPDPLGVDPRVGAQRVERRAHVVAGDAQLSSSTKPCSNIAADQPACASSAPYPR